MAIGPPRFDTLLVLIALGFKIATAVGLCEVFLITLLKVGELVAETMTFGEKVSHLEYQRREGCYAVIIDAAKQQVAVILTAKGQYFLPGGGIEKGETPEECLRREMLEETGFEVKISSYIVRAQRYFISSLNEPLLSDGIFYAAEFVEKVQEPIENDHDLRWINFDEVDDLLFHEHQSWAVKKTIPLFN